MSTIEITLANLGVVTTATVILWLISLRIEDVSIVDIFWGPAFALIAWTTFLATPGASARSLAIVIATTVWAVRLASYLAWRNLGKGEDHRYREMRERVGHARFRRLSLVTVFGFQAALVWLVSTPLQWGQMAPADSVGVTPLQIVGGVAFAIGLFFETVGDLQMARFKADPDHQGKVMDRGLWRYTRHPNYFGDFMVWWGLFAISLYTPGDIGRMGWTVIGPIVMTVLLVRVSGVALLEKSLKRRRPGYESYIRKTSALFPWPPRE